MRRNMKVKLAVGLSVASLLMFSGQLSADTNNAKALDLLQKGYAECKSAHIMRRQDFEQAQESYNAYLDLRDQATVMDAQILESEDAEVSRIVGYCETVGADMLRSQALPVFQEGALACGEAAEHVRNNKLDDAKKSYSRYLQQRDEAVAITEAVLEVFSVRSEERRCERIREDIELAEARLDEINEDLQERVDYLNETLSICHTLVETDLETAELDTLKAGVKEIEFHWEAAPNRETLEQEDLANLDRVTEIADISEAIESCQENVLASIEAREQAIIAAIAAEEERKRLEELARLEAESKVETEEERQQRLADNLEYYKLIKQVAPEFPRRAQRAGSEGYVVVEYNINPEGKVVDAVVIESSPAEIFDKAAIAAVSKWRYRAEFEDAEPDIAVARTRIRFALSN